MPILARSTFPSCFGSRMFSPSSSTVAFGALIRVELVDAVEDPQQRRFAAARRADEGRDLVLLQRKRDVLESPVLPIEKLRFSILILSFAGATGCWTTAPLDAAPESYARTRRSAHGPFLFDMSTRAAMLSSRTATVMIKAPVQASDCHSDRARGELEDGERQARHRRFQVEAEELVVSAVNRRGAVSPLTRAMASRMPVTMPACAAL